MGIGRTGCVTKVTGVHVPESAAVFPTPMHDLVLEYASQHYGSTTGFVDKIIGVGDATATAACESIDVFVFTVFAEENPIGHRVILMLHC